MQKQDRRFIKIMDVAYKNYGRVMKSCENHFVFVCVVSLFCFVCLELPRRESWKRNQFLGDLDVCRSLHPTRMGCFLTSYCLGGNREAKSIFGGPEESRKKLLSNQTRPRRESRSECIETSRNDSNMRT